MNSFELNKILGAVLFTCLCLLALNIGAGAVFSPVKPAKPGYEIAVKEHAEGGKEAAKEPEKPIAVLLASASVDKGKVAARKCEACHTFEKGGPNKVGPNLWGVVGRKIASHAGFDYSAAMKGKGGEWSFEELNIYLRNPRAEVPGTKMAFAGISRDTERADVINFLHSLADNPLPLPKAAEAQPASGGEQKAPAGQPAAAAPAQKAAPNAPAK
jgi:cytochrome c